MGLKLKKLKTPWLRLFTAIDESKIHPEALKVLKKYGRKYEGSIEFPLYIEKYQMLGYIDAIVEEVKKGVPTGEPIIGDFKIKHYTSKVFKDQLKSNLIPLEKDFTQVCVYLWELTENNILGVKPKKGMLWYYNSTEIGEIDAEQEFRIDFRDDLRELTGQLLDEHKKQALNYMNKGNCGCNWLFCPIHGAEEVNIRQWIS